jgi:hypothetical protein
MGRTLSEGPSETPKAKRALADGSVSSEAPRSRFRAGPVVGQCGGPLVLNRVNQRPAARATPPQGEP